MLSSAPHAKRKKGKETHRTFVTGARQQERGAGDMCLIYWTNSREKEKLEKGLSAHTAGKPS